MKAIHVALAAVLLVALASATATARNNNGVYFQVDTIVQTLNDAKVAYACNHGASFTALPGGSASLVYCSGNARIRFSAQMEAAPGAPPRYFTSMLAIDDDNAGHCGWGEAVILDIHVQGWDSSGIPDIAAVARPYCQYCAYTGGDCE